jgi:uncharacterized protein YidB (DUF937 family)
VEIGDVLGQVQGTGGDPKKVIEAVSKVISDEGGVGAVVSKLTHGGLGEQAASWVGSGKNLPADHHRVSKALGKRHVQRVAKDAGVSEAQAEDGIGAALPAIIDKLTPHGELPAHGGNELSELSGLR